eukprot:scaffold4995_cov95-Pinguiococcus_pyrenoidosus.AAC.1
MGDLGRCFKLMARVFRQETRQIEGILSELYTLSTTICAEALLLLSVGSGACSRCPCWTRPS